MIELSNNPLNKITHINHTHSQQHIVTKKKPSKSTHVPTACINCKKAHLACDLSRPCKRCSALGKCDTCIDIKHKKRGRPKLTASKKWQLTNTSTISTTIPMNNNNATITSPTGNFISLLPMAAPGLAACQFNMTLQNNQSKMIKSPLTADQLPQREMMTIFLSMDLCCARVSDESIEFLNVHPSKVDHCSFYDLIHSDSSETLSRIHRLLLDNSHSNRVPQQQPISFTTTASSDLFLTSSPAQLFQIANGSQTLRETLKFKNSGKSVSCRFYLGGGFGADLFDPSTLDNLYMVCIVSKLNSITSASNIVQDIPKQLPDCVFQQSTISPQAQQSSLVDSLLFQQEQQSFDSLLNTSDLLSMYNTTTPPSNTATNSSNSPVQSDTIQLVNHLYEAMLAPPTTPPTIEDYSLKSTPYHSSSNSDSSIGSGRFTTSLNQDLVDMKADIHAILNDDSLFMLNNNNSTTLPKTLLNDNWGYNIYA